MSRCWPDRAAVMDAVEAMKRALQDDHIEGPYQLYINLEDSLYTLGVFVNGVRVPEAVVDAEGIVHLPGPPLSGKQSITIALCLREDGDTRVVSSLTIDSLGDNAQSMVRCISMDTGVALRVSEQRKLSDG